MPFPECGYLYIASGEKHIGHAMISVKSLRSVDRQAHVTLITDRDFANDWFDAVVAKPFEYPFTIHPRFAASEKIITTKMFKIRHMAASPYRQTFFVDADTWFCDSARHLFGLLDSFDVLMAAAPDEKDLQPIKDQPLTGCMPYNTGVIVFEKKPATLALFQRWESIFKQKVAAANFVRGGIYDQSSFMEAWLESKAKIYVLPNTYNARIYHYIQLKGPVKIIHGQSSNYKRIAQAINASVNQRCWDPRRHRCHYKGAPGWLGLMVLWARDFMRFVVIKRARLFAKTHRMFFLEKIGGGRRIGSKTVFFYPEVPSRPNYTIYKICRWLGCRMHGDSSKKFDLAVYWQDTTFRQQDPLAAGLAGRVRVINAESNDISKSRVDAVFEKIFGYSARIDPLKYSGECVMKSDLNGQKKDGRVVRCPVDRPEPGRVYQKLIDNRCREDLVRDIRLPIFGPKVPFVYLKYKHIRERFRNVNQRVVLGKVEDWITGEELRKVMLFCGQMGLEFCELDVLRDGSDNRLYIVDANNTPCGPPNHISETDWWRALRMLACTFRQVFL